MSILFRVDSSSEIGLGHLMRCLVLAGQYGKGDVVFAVKNLEGNANQKIISEGFELVVLNNNSVDELVQKINELKVSMVVFDHYGIDDRFEKAIKDTTAVQILSFDDTYERHYCDILLNHNIYADVEKYKYLVPDFCEIRCGEKYTLIRDEFKKIKPKNRKINKNNLTVFVAMGGSDVNNINLEVLKVLIDISYTTINLATTNTNSNVGTLLEFSKQYPQVNIHINHPNIAKLMNDSDFAIITPSVTTYEVMALNLPFIAIQTADNQHYLANYLENNNFLLARTWNSNHIQTLIQSLLDL